MPGRRTRRKVAYRKKVQNRFSMVLVSLVVLMLLIFVLVRGYQMKKTIQELELRTQQLQEQIAQEQRREEEIELLRKKVQTKEYYEDVAKEKLGLVYPDEIVFRPHK